MSESMGEVIRATELTYDPITCFYGKYFHTQVSPSESLGSIPWTSGQTLSFQVLGSDVINNRESFLNFTLTADDVAGAANYTWIHGGCVPFFRTVSFQPSGGQSLQIDDFHRYSKLALPYFISREKLKSFEPCNIFCASKSLQTQNKHVPGGLNADTAYEEMRYAVSLDNGVVNTQVNFNVSIPFELLAGTIFAAGYDIKYGMNTIYQFTLEDPTKIIFTSTDQFDPTTGIAPTARTWRIVNPYLWIAHERDEHAKRLVEGMHNSGYSIQIPSIRKAFQQAPGGSSQNTVLPPLNRNIGHNLLRIFYGLFSATALTDPGAFFDNDNNPAVAGVAPTSNATARVKTYQTLWDGTPRQQKEINASPQFYAGSVSAPPNHPGQLAANGGNMDYAINKRFFEHSSYLNSNVLGHNLAIVDDFTMRQSRLEKEIKDEEAIKVQGVSLMDGDHTWQFQSTQGATANYLHYAFAQGQRTLQISPGVMQVV